VGGAAVLIEPRDTMSASGVCLALASAVCWALYLGMQDTCTAEERSSASFFGGVTLMVLGVCDVGRDCFEMHSLVIFVLLGICSSVLPLLLLARANKGLPATSIALLLLAEPVFATMGAYLIIGQAPSARSVIGLMVVLCGAASGTAALTPPLASTRARVGK
jgi:threonine/homoserine efflux transporter RhtA